MPLEEGGFAIPAISPSTRASGAEKLFSLQQQYTIAMSGLRCPNPDAETKQPLLIQVMAHTDQDGR